MGVFIFFVAGELGYRAYIKAFKPLHQPGKITGLLWEPTPGADVVEDGVRYRINSNGLRDYEYAVEKGKNVFRIAVVGDSVTWGYTELPYTYPKILESELKKLNGNFEVLNFGIRGTESHHHLAIVKERVMQYKPDLVILGYSLNDIRFSTIYDKPIIMKILQHSYFADFISVRLGTAAWKWRYGSGPEGGDVYYREHIKMYEDKERLSRLRNILGEMRDVLSARNVKFAVAVFPFRQQLDEREPYPQKALASILKEEGIPFFDFITELKSYKPDDLYLETDFLHFSPFGNEAVARSIKSFLLSKRLL